MTRKVNDFLSFSERVVSGTISDGTRKYARRPPFHIIDAIIIIRMYL